MTRYRQIVSPVGLDVVNQDTGGSQAAMELSDALSSFARVGNQFTGQLRAEQGATEGEAAGAAGQPQTRTGLRANTAYGRAYNSAAEAAYSSKMQTDIAAEFARLEQDHEGDLAGFSAVSQGYAEKLIAEAPPEYRVRVQQAVAARAAAGAARVRDQQMAFERAEHGAAFLAGAQARADLAVAGAMHLPREDGDAALAAAAEDNRLQLDAMVAEHVYTPLEAVKLQDAFMQSLDDGLFAQRTQPVVDALMNEAKTDVLKGDKLLAGVMADESIPLDERLTIRKAYDAQRTALAEDRSRAMIGESTSLAQRLAADESGAGVEGESWRLYRAGGISDAEHTGNLRKSVENGKKKIEQSIDIAAVKAALSGGPGLYPKNPDHVRAVNFYTDALVAASGMQPGDERWTATMVDIAKRTNILPEKAKEHAAINILDGDPLQAAKGAAFFAQIQAENSVAWDYNADPKLSVLADQLSRNVAAGIDPTRAYELAYTNAYKLTPEAKERLLEELGSKKNLSSENAGALKDALSADANFDPSVWVSSPDVRYAMQGEFDNLVSQYYTANGGKIDDARKLAGAAIRSRYGVTEMNGERELMKFAPERMFPGLTGDFIRQDLKEKLTAAGYGEVIAPEPPEPPTPIDMFSKTAPADTARRAAAAPPPEPPLPNKVRLVQERAGATERTQGLVWNIGVIDEDGFEDYLRGPDNLPLVYRLPIGDDFEAFRASEKGKQVAEAARLDEAARKRDRLYSDLSQHRADARLLE